jgi:homocysteine S-methyltransferase
MKRIDREAPCPPAGFSVNCVHASALEAALEAVAATDIEVCARLLAFQANTADCEVEDLDGSAELITEPPFVFAESLGRLRNRFNLRVVGGCCGTEGGHIEALAKKLSRQEV